MFLAHAPHLRHYLWCKITNGSFQVKSYLQLNSWNWKAERNRGHFYFVNISYLVNLQQSLHKPQTRLYFYDTAKAKGRNSSKNAEASGRKKILTVGSWGLQVVFDVGGGEGGVGPYTSDCNVFFSFSICPPGSKSGWPGWVTWCPGVSGGQRVSGRRLRLMDLSIKSES